MDLTKVANSLSLVLHWVTGLSITPRARAVVGEVVMLLNVGGMLRLPIVSVPQRSCFRWIRAGRAGFLPPLTGAVQLG